MVRTSTVTHLSLYFFLLFFPRGVFCRALSRHDLALLEPHYILNTPVLGTNYLALELTCPQNGSVLISFRTTLHTPVLNTNYLELELICPQNGSVLVSFRAAWSGGGLISFRTALYTIYSRFGHKLLGIKVNLSPKRECPSLVEPHYILHTPDLGTNCLELELKCPQNGSVLISFRTTLYTPVLNTNYLELELICPQNGSGLTSFRTALRK